MRILLLHPRGEPKSAAHVCFADDADITAHHLAEAPADRQPQAGAAVFARGGGIRLHERFEYFLHLRRRHADAGIAHPEHHAVLAVAPSAFDMQRDLAGFGKFARIADQVEQGLPQLGDVRLHFPD